MSSVLWSRLRFFPPSLRLLYLFRRNVPIGYRALHSLLYLGRVFHGARCFNIIDNFGSFGDFDCFGGFRVSIFTIRGCISCLHLSQRYKVMTRHWLYQLWLIFTQCRIFRQYFQSGGRCRHLCSTGFGNSIESAPRDTNEKQDYRCTSGNGSPAPCKCTQHGCPAYGCTHLLPSAICGRRLTL